MTKTKGTPRDQAKASASEIARLRRLLKGGDRRIENLNDAIRKLTDAVLRKDLELGDLRRELRATEEAARSAYRIHVSETHSRVQLARRATLDELSGIVQRFEASPELVGTIRKVAEMEDVETVAALIEAVRDSIAEDVREKVEAKKREIKP